MADRSISVAEEAPLSEDFLSFGEFCFDPSSAILYRDGARVSLPPRSLGVLAQLLEKPGTLVSREQLIEGVWNGTFVSDQSVSEAVQTLRQALGDDARHPTYIETVHRKGYRFIAEVSPAARNMPFPQPSADIDSSPGQLALWRRGLPWGLAGVAVGVTVASLVVWSVLRLIATVPQVPIRLAIELPSELRFTTTGMGRIVAISPDGAHVAFCAGLQPPANAPSNSQVYLRALDEQVPVPLSGTEQCSNPFFSPDGKWIGFWNGDELEKVSITGGTAVKLCNVADLYGVSWGDDGIVYGQGDGGIWRVPAEGGEPEQLFGVAQGELAQGPQMLPGGEMVLYSLLSESADWDEARIVVQSRASGERHVLVDGGREARYLPTGHLIYALGSDLLARPFDLERLEVEGAVPVVQGVMGSLPWRGGAHYALERKGTLVYIPIATTEATERSLVWVDRHGTSQLVTDRFHLFGAPRLSPDGKRVAVDIDTEPGRDIWILEIEQNIRRRLTTEGSFNIYPTWTPDGTKVTFASNRGGTPDIYWHSADFSDQQAELLLASNHTIVPAAWSPDGGTLVFRESNGLRGDLHSLTLGADWTPEMPQTFLATKFHERAADLSPDGSWIAYVSDLSGQDEIYVEPFPGPDGERVQVSDAGGRQPRWGPDGRELFYRSSDSMVVAGVDTSPPFKVVTRAVLFERTSWPAGMFRAMYDIHPDGQRFLMLEDLGMGEVPRQVRVVLNWFEELEQRVPIGR